MYREKYETEATLPDQVVLNSIQQKRIAAIAGEQEENIAGKNIAQLSEQLKWRIEPELFWFKRVCGKVVKKDPVTGIEYPVPFATVYIEDTDCNLLIYHPLKYPWSWHFPLYCHKEILATVQTDACGNFCAWIPRFDIDWILRWRRERYCFPIIFQRPTIKDLIEKTFRSSFPIPPDPSPLKQYKKFSSFALSSIGSNKMDILKQKAARTEMSSGLGTILKSQDQELDERLYDQEVPPPFSSDYQKALTRSNITAAKGASATDAIRSEIAGKLGLDTAGRELQGFDPKYYKGPFYRCIDTVVPEWQIVFDVPDITFRVMQDTNGDGIEETIYAEGYFDVRWDAGDLNNIKLVASSVAKESRFCYTPPVSCGNVPDLLFAGFMPLRNPAYFDDANGYALRPNMPRPSGTLPTTLPPDSSYAFPASTPFCGTLAFYGCVEIDNAVYYRVHQSTDNGVSYSAITGLGWNNFVGSTPIPISADANGWYPVQPINPVTLSPVSRASLEFPNLLLDWPTPLNEKSLLKIELGDGTKNHLSESNPVAIVSDNTAPNILLNTLSWKYEGEPDTVLRDLTATPCPMIKRGAVARNIELVFEVFVTASHFRDASIDTSGCGDGSFQPISDPANEAAHWHTSALDNSEVLYQRYRLDAYSKPGCYSFSCNANSRSMNPSGADGGNLIPHPDWYYNPVYLYTPFSISVAIVNEDLS